MHRLARLLGDPVSAREVVRTAWFDALERNGERPAELSTRGWLLGLVIHRLPPPTPPEQGAPAVPPIEFYDEGRWSGHWRTGRPEAPDRDPAAVEAAVARLAPGVAAVVLLRDVEDLEPHEIEVMLNRPPDQQIALLHHGRTAIRSVLAGE
jgi:DNA-directed RNA polymerase specialized sigma24 family protein